MSLKNELRDAHFRKIMDTATKFKTVMLKKNLTKAVTNCPVCKGERTLRGYLLKKEHRGSRPFSMSCSTPGCIALIE